MKYILHPENQKIEIYTFEHQSTMTNTHPIIDFFIKHNFIEVIHLDSEFIFGIVNTKFKFIYGVNEKCLIKIKILENKLYLETYENYRLRNYNFCVSNFGFIFSKYPLGKLTSQIFTIMTM